MLINFVGSPCSGKTSIASRVFEKLKSTDAPTDWICEQARLYIVQKRYQEKIPYSKQPVLTSEDQIKILQKQVGLEGMFVSTTGPGVVLVSDGSPLNTLLYLPEEIQKSEEVQKLIAIWISFKPVIFWTRFFAKSFPPDQNRIHDTNFARDADENKIPKLLEQFPELNVTQLTGSFQERLNTATWSITDYLVNGGY